MLRFKFLISVVAISFFSSAWANQQISVPSYFVSLSKHTNVPADILYALSVQETNTKMNNNGMSPWPYTINLKGRGYRYKNYESMMTAANQLVERGYSSFDIGPFQVNWKWHQHRVDSLASLGEPLTNGIIAAEILKEQFKLHGDWAVAAGRYHNPNNNRGLALKYEDGYREKLELIQSGKYQALSKR